MCRQSENRLSSVPEYWAKGFLRPALSFSDLGAAGELLISQQSEIANVVVLTLTDPHPVHYISLV
jgi:hypothetical protein